MSVFLSLAVLFSASGASLSGVVAGPSGEPAEGVRVFVEPGLGLPVAATETGSDGSYHLDGLPEGLAGVFAIAPGYAWSGCSVTLGPGDDRAEAGIRLAAPGHIEGRVRDHQGDSVEGAEITRVLLIQGERKVSAPLGKLAAWGFEPPVTDHRGRFRLERLPAGAEAAFKVSHPDYAQATAAGVQVGDDRVRVTMQPGVLLHGSVTSRGKGLPVADAVIILRNARPPHNTVLTQTGPRGNYSVRVEPGDYLYHAATSASRSPGARRLRAGAEGPQQRADLVVAGRARLSGEVRDAVTGEPVAGAKLRLYAHGNPAAVTTTRGEGVYVFDSTEGENAVRLQSAPGYMPPERNAITLDAAEGETAALPTFWLKPIPELRVLAADASGAPVAGACVSLAYPPRLGWDIAGPDGEAGVSVASMPGEGVIVGVAEHPRRPQGALFALDAREERRVTVAMEPWAEIRGQVTDGDGDGLEGAVVTGVVDLEGMEDPPALWRCVSGPEGRFTWRYAPAGVRQKGVAVTTEGRVGESLSVTPEPGAPRSLGRIVIPEGEPGQSLLGSKLDLGDYLHAGGPPPTEHRPHLVMFCPAAEAAAVAEWMRAAREKADLDGLGYVVVADGQAPSLGGVTCLRGSAPGTASTYLLTPDGRVTLECLGIPPAAALRALEEGRLES